MNTAWAGVAALGICAVAAAAEGLCAGAGVREHLARLRQPRFSPPLWAWLVIGALYYAVCFAVLYRTLAHEGLDRMRVAAVALGVAVMAVNALWNFAFFRARNLLLSLVIFLPYDLLAAAWCACLWQFDVVAAWLLAAYLAYLVYANVWCFALWRLNGRPA